MIRNVLESLGLGMTELCPLQTPMENYWTANTQGGLDFHFWQRRVRSHVMLHK